MLTVTPAKPNFQLLYYGFKITRPMVADARVREAMSIAINRAEIAASSATLVDDLAPVLAEAYDQVAAQVLKERPVIYLYHRNWLWAYNAKLAGVRGVPARAR